MTGKGMLSQKKRFEIPDTYVIVFFLVLFAVFLAYTIPPGSYKSITDEAGKRIGVDPSSFAFTDVPKIGINTVLGSLYNGLKNGANTIFLVLIIGGVFQIIIETGSLDAIIGFAIERLKDKAILVFPIIMIIMLSLGALGIGINVALAFIPIGVILCKKFKLDPIVVVAMFYMTSNTGFSASPVNPFTVLLAQDLSGVQYMSGFAFRAVVWIICAVIAVAYVMRYMIRIKNDPNRSLVGIYEEDSSQNAAEIEVRSSQLIIFIAMIAAFSYYTWGAIKYNWALEILAGHMVALGLFSGIISGMGANNIAKHFVKGCQLMVYSAVLVGLASAISVVLTKAGVIHSIVYYLCIPLASLSKAMAACGMFVVNAIFNIFIPSGSGQAYVTVPLMAPMADVLGFSRQIAISAFQYGDGFMNAIQPTTSLLMGCLGIAGVPYTKWFRFSLPLFGLFCFVSFLTLIVMVSIGWA